MPRYYGVPVKTITIKLPDFLNASLDAAATSRKKTKSEIVRELLLQTLPAQKRTAPRRITRPSLHDQLRKYQDAGPSGVKDLASNPAHLAGYGRK